MPGGASAASATLITSLPYTDADTVPTTAGLWYKYVCPASGVPNEIGIFPFSVTASSQRIRIYSPDAVTPFPPRDPISGPAAPTPVSNRPIQIPVVAGVTYYINIYNQAGAYTLSVIAGPDEPVPIGSIFVNDSEGDWPLALLSATDGHVLRFIHPFPCGETADVIASGPGTGRMLVHYRGTQTGDTTHVRGDGHLHLYSPQFELLADLPYTPTGDSYVCPIRWGRTSGSFYVGQQTDPANGGNGSVTTVTADGAFGPTTWNLSPDWNIGTIAPSGDETILYAGRLSFGTPRVLAQWDLVNNVALPDLAAAIPNFHIEALLVLGDDTILVAYVRNVPNVEPFVRRYDSTGTILNTYTLTGGQSSDVRLARALDDPVSVWVWTKTTATEALSGPNVFNRFQNLRVSDGAILSTFSVPQFGHGTYAGLVTGGVPLARFGASESCPFLIIREALVPSVTLDVTDPPAAITIAATVSPQLQECPCPDDPWPLSTMRDQIGARLHDPSHIRWTVTELNRIIWEALRTWNAFTSWASGRTTITLTPGVAFYQLNDLAPALRAPYVSDGELYNGINDKLLEMVATTPQFSQDFLVKSYGRRHQNVLVESGVVLVRRLETIAIPSDDGRYLLDPCILAVRRVAWSENGDSSAIPLYRDDQWGEDRYLHRFPQTPTRRPRVWSMSTRPPQYLQLVPIPTHTGTLDFICIIDCTPVPPDWTWIAPFGVLADLLGQSGPGQDLERAKYAEARYRHGLEAMKSGSVVQSVRVENTLVPVHPCPDLDQYKRLWQTRTGLPREAVTFGQTIIGFSPVPDAAYSVTLDLTQIAPLPAGSDDLVFLPPAARDPVLDYAEHLALFKEGPGPLAESMFLLDRFLTAAGVRLSLDQALVPSRGSLWAQASADQRGPSPHHLAPEPALLSGVGVQPMFPNPAAQPTP